MAFIRLVGKLTAAQPIKLVVGLAKLSGRAAGMFLDKPEKIGDIEITRFCSNLGAGQLGVNQQPLASKITRSRISSAVVLPPGNQVPDYKQL